MAPTAQKAIVVQEDGSLALREVPVPKPGPNEILVKIVAAAQNPTDWKTAKFAKRAGSVSGCDFSGTVEEVGSGVPEGLRTVGERVAGFVHGGIRPYGSFSEYLITSADFVVHVPDAWSLEDAAQLGIAPFTALQVLYESLALPTPLEPATTPTPVLIAGGATSVGQWAIQFAKLSGLRVLATASQRNFDFVRGLGADVVVDYRDSAAAAKQLREAAPDLEYAVDCVGDSGSPQLVAAALGGKGALATITRPYPSELEGTIKNTPSIVYDWLGKGFDFPTNRPVDPEKAENGRKWAKNLSELLAKTNLRPNPLLLKPLGLASVAEGFQYMLDGKVSAQKITYRIADTPKE
ncbi:dehydrogenase [Gloeopeniophorella convolvens]|nr:dehydrogenase [Gloeopeniophorella convolvens]